MRYLPTTQKYLWELKCQALRMWEFPNQQQLFIFIAIIITIISVTVHWSSSSFNVTPLTTSFLPRATLLLRIHIICAGVLLLFNSPKYIAVIFLIGIKTYPLIIQSDYIAAKLNYHIPSFRKMYILHRVCCRLREVENRFDFECVEA